MILTAAIFVPLLGALAIAAAPIASERVTRLLGALVAAVPLALLALAWAGFDPAGERFQHVTDVAWIPAIGAGYRVGVDGISLTVATLSALLFVASVAYPTDLRGMARKYVAWMLFLESVSLGFFLALDLLLFYVFFDLSLVGMYFLIGIWGHEDRERAALKFILFTLAGSLVMLLGILSLALAMDPVSFDMRALIEAQPVAGTGLRAGLTLLALLFGLAVKTPLVPVHTWLPAAHVEAPAPASAILAGVLLKMGTYGMIRVAWEMLRETFAEWAWLLGVVAVVSIVYGAFVALGQQHIKRRIAYTSITHMGYTVLGIAMAASVAVGQEEARRLALVGATLEMIAHGLITGSLFLLAGSIYRRGESFSMNAYGGLARSAPWLTVSFGVREAVWRASWPRCRSSPGPSRWSRGSPAPPSSGCSSPPPSSCSSCTRSSSASAGRDRRAWATWGRSRWSPWWCCSASRWPSAWRPPSWSSPSTPPRAPSSERVDADRARGTAIGAGGPGPFMTSRCRSPLSTNSSPRGTSSSSPSSSPSTAPGRSTASPPGPPASWPGRRRWSC